MQYYHKDLVIAYDRYVIDMDKSFVVDFESDYELYFTAITNGSINLKYRIIKRYGQVTYYTIPLDDKLRLVRDQKDNYSIETYDKLDDYANAINGVEYKHIIKAIDSIKDIESICIIEKHKSIIKNLMDLKEKKQGDKKAVH